MSYYITISLLSGQVITMGSDKDLVVGDNEVKDADILLKFPSEDLILNLSIDLGNCHTIGEILNRKALTRESIDKKPRRKFC